MKVSKINSQGCCCGAVDRFIMGSTTAYVVRNANVQVLVVND
ncbi:universal stress protein [Lentilactobacillus farraginis]|nr:universal stress protein [Lentilactobacillus farraginis]